MIIGKRNWLQTGVPLVEYLAEISDVLFCHVVNGKSNIRKFLTMYDNELIMYNRV